MRKVATDITEQPGWSLVNSTAGNKTVTTTTIITNGNEKKENPSNETEILGGLDMFLSLPQKICKAFPDIAYAISSPNVILVGARSAGKTSLMVKMIFHHLVDKDFFTDEIGYRLLSFLTGFSHRPISVVLSNSDNCRVRLVLGTQSAEFSNIKQFDALLYQPGAGKNIACMEEAVLSVYASTLPNVSFTDLTGLCTIDQALCDSKTTTTTKLACEYMKRPHTIIFAVESASCEDYSTSLIVPLMKNIQECFRKDIFEHSVLVLSKCDKIVLPGRDEERIRYLVNLTDPQLKNFPFKHVVGTINDIDCKFERDQYWSMVKFNAKLCKVNAHERSVFAEFKSSETRMSQETQCTITAVFNKIDDISNSKLCVSMNGGLSIIETKLEEQKLLIIEKLAPPLSYYNNAQSAKMVFVSDLEGSVEQLAQAAYDALFEFKPYHRVDERLSALGLPPKLILGGMNSNTLRSDYVNKLIEHVEKHLSTTFFHEYEKMFTSEDPGSQCLCLSRNVSALNRVDRFPQICSIIQSQMQSQLPICLQNAVAAFRQTTTVRDWGMTLQQSDERNCCPYVNMYRVLDNLMNDAAIYLFGEVRKAVSRLNELIVDDESLWEEAQDFHSERVLMESTYNRLQAQKLRLEKCMARKEELDRSGDSEHSLRLAVDEAVANDASDLHPIPATVWEEMSRMRMLQETGPASHAGNCLLEDDAGLRERTDKLPFIFDQPVHIKGIEDRPSLYSLRRSTEKMQVGTMLSNVIRFLKGLGFGKSEGGKGIKESGNVLIRTEYFE